MRLERFDVSRGYEFDTFATPTIIGEIKRYYRDREWLIRIPRKVQDLNREINQTRDNPGAQANAVTNHL